MKTNHPSADFLAFIKQDLTQQINYTLEKALEKLQHEIRQELKYVVQHIRQNNFTSLQKGLNITTRKGLTLEQLFKKITKSWSPL